MAQSRDVQGWGTVSFNIRLLSACYKVVQEVEARRNAATPKVLQPLKASGTGWKILKTGYTYVGHGVDRKARTGSSWPNNPKPSNFVMVHSAADTILTSSWILQHTSTPSCTLPGNLPNPRREPEYHRFSLSLSYTHHHRAIANMADYTDGEPHGDVILVLPSASADGQRFLSRPVVAHSVANTCQYTTPGHKRSPQHMLSSLPEDV